VTLTDLQTRRAGLSASAEPLVLYVSFILFCTYVVVHEKCHNYNSHVLQYTRTGYSWCWQTRATWLGVHRGRQTW